MPPASEGQEGGMEREGRARQKGYGTGERGVERKAEGEKAWGGQSERHQVGEKENVKERKRTLKQ